MQPRNRSHLHGLITTLPLALLLAACGAGASPTSSSHSTPTPTPVPTPSVPATTPTRSPTPSAPVIGSPLAVIGSENVGIGPYTLGLVNAQGTVVAAVTATTPSDYYSGGDPMTTSTSDSRLYYEDGNTNIDYLTSTGQHGVAFTVSRPSGAVVAFAVSPDDSRVAVAVLTNFNGDAPPYTSHMYLMAMGGGIQQTLFDGNSKSSTAPLTWPVGWDGANLVVAQSLAGSLFRLWSRDRPLLVGGSPSRMFCASQLRVFNPVDRTFGPPLCPMDIGAMTGSPTAAGIACGAGTLQPVPIRRSWQQFPGLGWSPPSVATSPATPARKTPGAELACCRPTEPSSLVLQTLLIAGQHTVPPKPSAPAGWSRRSPILSTSNSSVGWMGMTLWSPRVAALPWVANLVGWRWKTS